MKVGEVPPFMALEMKMIRYVFLLSFSLSLLACSENKNTNVEKRETGDSARSFERIVTLHGALTETVYALGYGDRIKSVDVTSTYPESMKELPQLGHVTKVSAEGLLSVKPELIIANKHEISAELKNQINLTNAELLLIDREYTVEGTRAMIRTIAEKLQATEKGDSLIAEIDEDLQSLKSIENKPAVLFIYARGAGNMSVGGANTPAGNMIELAGGKNAVSTMEGYKPLTPEAVVEADPQAILMFDMGVESLEGMQGVKSIPAIASTQAAKNDEFIIMDGHLLAGFGPRVGKALLQLNQEFTGINE